MVLLGNCFFGQKIETVSVPPSRSKAQALQKSFLPSILQLKYFTVSRLICNFLNINLALNRVRTILLACPTLLILTFDIVDLLFYHVFLLTSYATETHSPLSNFNSYNVSLAQLPIFILNLILIRSLNFARPFLCQYVQELFMIFSAD